MSNEVDYAPGTVVVEEGDGTQNVDVVVTVEYVGEEAAAAEINDIEKKTEAIKEQEQNIKKLTKAELEHDKAVKNGSTSQTPKEVKTVGQGMKKVEVGIKFNNKALSESVASLGKFSSVVDESTTSVGNFSFAVNDATAALRRFEDKLNDISGRSNKKMDTVIDPTTGFRQGGHRDTLIKVYEGTYRKDKTSMSIPSTSMALQVVKRLGEGNVYKPEVLKGQLLLPAPKDYISEVLRVTTPGKHGELIGGREITIRDNYNISRGKFQKKDFWSGLYLDTERKGISPIYYSASTSMDTVKAMSEIRRKQNLQIERAAKNAAALEGELQGPKRAPITPKTSAKEILSRSKEKLDRTEKLVAEAYKREAATAVSTSKLEKVSRDLNKKNKQRIAKEKKIEKNLKPLKETSGVITPEEVEQILMTPEARIKKFGKEFEFGKKNKKGEWVIEPFSKRVLEPYNAMMAELGEDDDDDFTPKKRHIAESFKEVDDDLILSEFDPDAIREAEIEAEKALKKARQGRTYTVKQIEGINKRRLAIPTDVLERAGLSKEQIEADKKLFGKASMKVTKKGKASKALAKAIVERAVDITNRYGISTGVDKVKDQRELTALLHTYFQEEHGVDPRAVSDVLLSMTPTGQYIVNRHGADRYADIGALTTQYYAGKRSKDLGQGEGTVSFGEYEHWIKTKVKNYQIGSATAFDELRNVDTPFDMMSEASILKLMKDAFYISVGTDADGNPIYTGGHNSDKAKMLLTDNRFWKAVIDKQIPDDKLRRTFGKMAPEHVSRLLAMRDKMAANPAWDKKTAQPFGFQGPRLDFGKVVSTKGNRPFIAFRKDRDFLLTLDGVEYDYEKALASGRLPGTLQTPAYGFLANYTRHDLTNPNTFAKNYQLDAERRKQEWLDKQNIQKLLKRDIMGVNFKWTEETLAGYGFSSEVEALKAVLDASSISTSTPSDFKKMMYNANTKAAQRRVRSFSKSVEDAKNGILSDDEIDRIVTGTDAILKNSREAAGIKSLTSEELHQSVMSDIEKIYDNFTRGKIDVPELSNALNSFIGPIADYDKTFISPALEEIDRAVQKYGSLDDFAVRKIMVDTFGYTTDLINGSTITDFVARMKDQSLKGASEEHFLAREQIHVENLRKQKALEDDILAGAKFEREFGKSIGKLENSFVMGKLSIEEFIRSLHKLGLTEEEIARSTKKLSSYIDEYSKETVEAEKATSKLINEMKESNPAILRFSKSFDKATESLGSFERASKHLDELYDSMGKKRKKGQGFKPFTKSGSELSGLALGSMVAAFQSGRKIDELVTELTFQASDGQAVISWTGALNEQWGNISTVMRAQYQRIADSMKALSLMTTTSYTGMLEAAVEIVKAGLSGAAASAVLVGSALVADMENMKIVDVVSGMLGAGRAMGIATSVDTEGKTETTKDDSAAAIVQDWMNFYADVLLAADMTGSSVKEVIDGLRYFAPLVTAIGISEEEAIALSAIMGNVGLAGQKGARTTASGLVRLATPNEKAISALESMGLSIYDEQGNMRAITDIIYDFGTAYNQMSDEEKAAFSNTVMGKEALKGFSGLGAQAGEFAALMDALTAEDTGAYMWQRYASEFWGVSIDEVVKQSKKFYDGAVDTMGNQAINDVRASLTHFNDMLSHMGVSEIEWYWDTSETIMKNLADLEAAVAKSRNEFLAGSGNTMEEWNKMIEYAFGDVEEELEDLRAYTQEFFLEGLAETDPFKVLGISLMTVFGGLLKVGQEVTSNLAFIAADLLPDILKWIDDINDALEDGNYGEDLAGIVGDAATLSLLGMILGSIHKIIFAMRWPLLISAKLNDEFKLTDITLESILEKFEEIMGIYVKFVKIKMVGDLFGLAASGLEAFFQLKETILQIIDTVIGFFEYMSRVHHDAPDAEGNGPDEEFEDWKRYSKKGKAKQTSKKDPYGEYLKSIEVSSEEQIDTTIKTGNKIVDAIEDSYKYLGEIIKGVEDVETAVDKGTTATKEVVDNTDDLDKREIEIDTGKGGTKGPLLLPAPGKTGPDMSGAIYGPSLSQKPKTGKPGTPPIPGDTGKGGGLGPMATTALAGIAAIPGPWLALMKGIGVALQTLNMGTIRNINSTQEWMRAYVTPYHKYLYDMLPEETQIAMQTVLNGAAEIEGGLQNLTPLSVFLYAGFDTETQQAIYDTMVAGDEIQAVYDSLPIYAQRIWDDMSLLTQAAIVELGGVEPVLDEIAAEFPKLGKLIQEQMTDEFKGAKTEVGKVLEELYKVSAELDKDHKKTVTTEYKTIGTPPTYVDSEGDGSNDLTDKYMLPVPPPTPTYPTHPIAPEPEPIPLMPYIQSSFGLGAYTSRGLGHNITNNNTNDNRVFNISYNVESGREDTAFDRMVADLRRV